MSGGSCVSIQPSSVILALVMLLAFNLCRWRGRSLIGATAGFLCIVGAGAVVYFAMLGAAAQAGVLEEVSGVKVEASSCGKVIPI